MAPFIPFLDCAEVVVRGSLGGQNVFLTNMVKKASAFGGTDLSDIADIFIGWLHNHLFPGCSTLYAVADIKVTDLTSQFAPTVIVPMTAPVNGSLGGGSIGSNQALVVSYHTAQRGRSFRGRNYVAGLASSNLADPAHFNSGAGAVIAGVYTTLGTLLSTAGFTHVVGSRHENKVVRSVGLATPITLYTGSDKVGTQRRRSAWKAP